MRQVTPDPLSKPTLQTMPHKTRHNLVFTLFKASSGVQWSIVCACYTLLCWASCSCQYSTQLISHILPNRSTYMTGLLRSMPQMIQIMSLLVLSACRFFVYFLVLLLTNVASNALFRGCAAVARDPIISSTVGVLAMYSLVFSGGIMLARSKLSTPLVHSRYHVSSANEMQSCI